MTDRAGNPRSSLERRLVGHLGHGKSLDPGGCNTLEQLMVFLENERRMLAFEVHDVLSQSVASLFYRLQASEYFLGRDPSRVTEEISYIRQLAEQLSEDVTRVLYDLRPPVLDLEGVIPAIRRYTVEFHRQTGLDVTIEAVELPHRLGDMAELFLYRIVQESLSNVHRHAAARRIDIRLSIEESQLVGIIQDDGIGCELSAANDSASRPHFGLIGMKDRMTLLGGEFSLESGKGTGTRIGFRLPLSENLEVGLHDRN